MLDWREDTTIMGKDYCPKCKKLLNAATSVEEGVGKPDPHDVCVCIHCGAILEYGEDMGLVELNMTDFNKIDHPTRIQILRVQRLILNNQKNK